MSIFKFIQGASSVSLGSLISVIVIFSTQVLLSRTLNTDEFGDFISSVAILTIFSTFSTFGSELSLLKKFGVSNAVGNQYGATVYKFTLVSSIISCLFMLMFFSVTSDIALEFQLLLLPCIVAFAIWSLSNVVYQVQHKYFTLATHQVLPSLIRLVSIALVMFFYDSENTGSLTAAYWSYFIAAFILILFCIKNFLKLKLGSTLSNTSSLPCNIKYGTVFKNSFPFSIAAILFAIYAQNGLYSVNKYVGSHESAAYGIAISFIFAIYIIPGVIYQKVVLPKFHVWSNHDKGMLLKTLQLGNGIMLLVGCFFSICTIIMSETVVSLFFGEKYIDAVEILQILALCIPFRFMISNLGALLSTGDNVKYKIYGMLIVVMFFTLLNTYVAKFFGSVAVAYLFVVSEIIMFLVFIFIVQFKVYGLEVWLGWFKFRGVFK